MKYRGYLTVKRSKQKGLVHAYISTVLLMQVFKVNLVLVDFLGEISIYDRTAWVSSIFSHSTKTITIPKTM